MLKKTFSEIIVLTMMLTGMFTLAFNIQQAKAWTGTVYIRADGSIDPVGAPVQRNGDIYTLTDNITSSGDGIVVQRDNIIIDGAGYTVQGSGSGTGIYLFGRKNVTVRNTQIQNFNYGIWLGSSSNNTVIGNNIANNGDGVMLYSSSNNSICGNNITANNHDGISLYSSSNNSIVGNNITANNGDGIWLDCSSNNSIVGNTFTNDGLFVWGSYRNVVEDNTVNGKPLVYLEGVANYSVGDAGQVILINCTGIRVENLNLSRASVGLQLWKTNNTIISENNIANNGDGIRLGYSSNNSICGNNITANNDYGIQLYYSSNNAIYYNNFVDNSQQVYSCVSTNIWDDGYPSGGNYWSDYTGTDLYSGPEQNVTGSDGVGDMPYVINGNNVDRYPLMKPYPWGSHDVGITSLTTSKTVVGQGYNLSINMMLFNYGNNTENFNITIYANTTVIGTFENITLASRNSTTITLTLNTTGWDKGNYTIWAYAWPVPGETDTTDNTFTYGIITVTILGDVDGDFDVDIYDVVKITSIYGFNKNDPQFNPNSDLDDDGTITIYDVVRCTAHYGETYP